MAGIEEAFEKFSDRLAREETKRYSKDEQGDYREYLPEEQDQYPIKLGPLQLGANANIATGKFSPNEYQNVSTMNRNVGLRGRYDVPDSGIALLGSIGDVRSNQNVKTNLPFNPMTGEASPYSEMTKDVYKDSPYSVGAQYTPQGTNEMYSALYNKGGGYNLGYNKGPVNVSYTSNPGLGNNVMLRGQYNFADGGVASMFRERPGYQVGGTIDPFALQRSPIDQYGYSDPVISALTGNIFTSGQRFRDVFSPQAGLMMQQAQAAGYSEPEMEELRYQQDFFPSFKRSLDEAYFGPTFQADPQKSAIDLATSIYNQRFQAPPSIQQPNQQTVQQQILQQAQQPQMSYNEMQKADYARRMGELENKFAKQGTSATKYIQDMTNLLAQMKTSGGIDPLGAMQSKYYTGPSSGSVSEGRGIDANFVINRAQQAEREAAARVTPTKKADGGIASFDQGGQVKSYEEQTLNKKGYETTGMSKKEIFDLYDSVMGTFSKRFSDGGRVSMSDGGLTTTTPPDKGPDSQGVESLFRRRYS